MNIYVYAGFSYLFTAVIALFMIGTIVFLNKIMGDGSDQVGGGGE